MHYNDEVYKEVLRIKVTDELNSIGNPKCLYVHKDLLDLLNFAVGFKLAELVSEKRIFIFEHDVEAIDIDSANNVVLFLHPIVHHMKTVASIVLHNASSNVTKNYYLYFVPNVDFLCVEELKRQTVAAKINIRSFHFGAIPLAPRVVSQ